MGGGLNMGVVEPPLLEWCPEVFLPIPVGSMFLYIYYRPLFTIEEKWFPTWIGLSCYCKVIFVPKSSEEGRVDDYVIFNIYQQGYIMVQRSYGW